MATEEAAFNLVLKEGAFELRDYLPRIVAEVTVTGTQQEAGRKGFRKLAGYIFGGNTTARRIEMTTPVSKVRSGQKIAMTAPVSQIAEGGEWVVRFTMPAAIDLADLPTPNDPSVTLKTMPAERLAVIRFSGLARETSVTGETRKLQACVQSHGLEVTGAVSQARYDPPWTPWFLRRNEVMVPVRMAA